MSDRLPKLDSHVIDFFLDMAQKYEEELDDETYATVKDIFAKDLEPFENSKKLSAWFPELKNSAITLYL